MAVKTIWPISYACGHSEQRDLPTKPVDERAGYARWPASKDCTDCRRAAQADAHRASTRQWVAQKRAEESQQTSAWEHKASMPPLDGSEKATAWGRHVRHLMLTRAYETLVVEGGLSDDLWVLAIETPARRITRASWWIDNRDTDPADIAELISAAQATTGVGCENDA